MIDSILRWFKNFFYPPKAEQLDLGRRKIMGAGLVGLSGGLIFRIHPQSSGNTYNPALIRPPGSLSEEEFLAKCVRCGECMKVCPTNAIHPASFEAGLEGMWTPVLKMKVGNCEYECTLCTQVCPTGAIRELTLPEKRAQKIGQAFFDKNRCIPYTFSRECIVCEEHCPTPEKAIWFEEVEVLRHNGETLIVKQPKVDPDLCVGCGICMHVCPIKDEPGIYVTSVGETRNPDNQFLLTTSDPYGESNSDSSSDPYGNSSPY